MYRSALPVALLLALAIAGCAIAPVAVKPIARPHIADPRVERVSAEQRGDATVSPAVPAGGGG